MTNNLYNGEVETILLLVEVVLEVGGQELENQVDFVFASNNVNQ